MEGNMVGNTVLDKDFLQSMRQKGDDLADQFIANVMAQQAKAELQDTFAQIFRGAPVAQAVQSLPAALQQPALDFFKTTSQFPAWADLEKMKTGSQIFAMYGPEINMLLLCKSLPTCYTCWRGAAVLNMTGRLLVHDGSYQSYTRRLVETAQYVINVLSPGAFEQNGKAMPSIQVLRLVHAAIRNDIMSGNWDQEKLGLPINQEDMAGTLLSFSVLVLEGLRQMNVPLTDDQKEAYLHTWRVVSYLQGIDDHLNPETYEDSLALVRTILDKESAASDDGKALADGCIDFMQHMVPDKRFDQLGPSLIRFFLGKTYADMLAIPDVSYMVEGQDLRDIRNLVDGEARLEQFKPFQDLTCTFSHFIIEGFCNFFNAGKNRSFEIPSSLTDSWRPLDFTRNIPTVTNINEAIHWMRLLVDFFKNENNPMGYFCAVYELVTRRVAEGIANKEFQDNEKMEQVDVGFAVRYFAAVNSYLKGEPASLPWQISFDAAKNTGLVVDQHIFVAANAHINYDLAISVSNVFPGQSVYQFEHDFNYMNQLFNGMYAQMNSDIGEIWTPFSGSMKVAGGAIQDVENYFMKLGRNAAWANALRLATATDQQSVLADMEANAKKIGTDMIEPPLVIRMLIKKIEEAEQGSVADKIDVMLRTNLIPQLT